MSFYFHEENPSSKQPTLLLIHGGGASWREWLPLIQRLSPKYHILAPDLPSHGRTEGPFTFETAVKNIADLIKEKAHGGKACVLGLSLGGFTALTFIQRHPELVSKCFVTGACEPLSSWQGMFGVYVVGPMFSIFKIKRLRDWAFSYAAFDLSEEHRNLIFEDMFSSGSSFQKRAGEFYGEIVHKFTLPKKDDKIEKFPPTLLFCGEKEGWLVPEIKRTLVVLKELNSGCKGFVVEGGYHGWDLQMPDLFAEAVRAWLEDGEMPIKIHSI